MRAAILAGCAALTLATSAFADPAISVQLWSVRDDVKADFEGTLRQLADLGFEGVEFARDYGPYADDPVALKAFMDEIGLACTGAHVGFDMLGDDRFETSLSFHKALGCGSMVVAMDHRAFDPEGIDWVVNELNAVAEKLDGSGLRTGYHNHWQEFADFQEATFWDYLATHTDERVILQLDVGNMQPAGMDPVAYVRRYPGRTWSTHFKATLPEGAKALPLIGHDTIDWAGLLDAVNEVGGTAWLIVEQEDYPEGMTPMAAVTVSKSGLENYIEQRRKSE